MQKHIQSEAIKATDETLYGVGNQGKKCTCSPHMGVVASENTSKRVELRATRQQEDALGSGSKM